MRSHKLSGAHARIALNPSMFYEVWIGENIRPVCRYYDSLFFDEFACSYRPLQRDKIKTILRRLAVESMFAKVNSLSSRIIAIYSACHDSFVSRVADVASLTKDLYVIYKNHFKERRTNKDAPDLFWASELIEFLDIISLDNKDQSSWFMLFIDFNTSAARSTDNENPWYCRLSR